MAKEKPTKKSPKQKVSKKSTSQNDAPMDLGGLIAQFAENNKLLEQIAVNTELGTLAAIDSSANVIDPSVFAQINKNLENVYGALCFEVTEALNNSADILTSINRRAEVIMEDVAHMAILMSDSADNYKEYVKKDIDQSKEVRNNTKKTSEVNEDEKDVIEKTANDSASLLEKLIDSIRSSREDNTKFGEKSIDQIKDLIEVLKEGEKKDTVKSLLWNKRSQEASQGIKSKLSDLFGINKKSEEDTKALVEETKKEEQLQLKGLEDDKVLIKQAQITAEESKNAGEQMQLQGLEDKAESKTVTEQTKKTSGAKAKFEKIGAMDPGKMLGGWLESIGGFVATVTEVIEAVVAIGAIVSELFLPITIAIAAVVAVIDFISGFIDGFKNTEGSFGDKLLGGIKEGLMRVLDDLLYLIVDLPKKAISWLLGMFGLDEWAKAVDEFDLTEYIKKGFGAVFDFLVDWNKNLFQMPIDIVTDLWKQLTNMFDGSASDIAQKIGVFLLDIMYMPLTLVKNLAAWVADKLGFGDIAQSLKEIDIGEMIMDGLLSAVDMIKNFFSNAWDGITGLWDKVKNFDFIGSLKDGLGGVIKTLLEPLPFSDKLIKKAFSVIGIEDSGATSKIISSPDMPDMPGATMNALQADTEQAKAAVQDIPSVVSAPGGGGGSSNGSSNTNISSVTYASNNVPDRTAWQMTPAFGY